MRLSVTNTEEGGEKDRICAPSTPTRRRCSAGAISAASHGKYNF